MSKGLSRQERMVRIELARARAALERRSLANNMSDVCTALTPAGLLRGVMGGASGRSRGFQAGRWLTDLLAVSRRYPFLLSTASAVLSTMGRRRGGLLWKVGLGALAGWKVLHALQNTDRRL